jgi:arsenate reductase
MTKSAFEILVLCTGNSARSILGEALLNHYGAGRIRAYSAGSQPKGQVHPMALATLKELGVDPGQPQSKSWDQFARDDGPSLDLAITVCDSAAGESCPLFTGAPLRVHWGLPDPAGVVPEDAAREAFRRTALALALRVGGLLQALDLPRQELGEHLRRIGHWPY